MEDKKTVGAAIDTKAAGVLSISELVAAVELTAVKVVVPDCNGETVFLRALTAQEVSIWEAGRPRTQAEVSPAKSLEVMTDLIHRSLCDRNGEPIGGDRAELTALPKTAIDALWNRCVMLNGLSTDAEVEGVAVPDEGQIEALEGN